MGTVHTIPGLVKWYAEHTTGPSELVVRGRDQFFVPEELYLWEQADRLGWNTTTARTPSAVVRAGHLNPGSWVAWVLSVRLLQDAVTQAAEQARRESETEHRAENRKRTHTCAVCGRVDYATTQTRRILDPSRLADPATTPGSGVKVLCCQACHDALRAELAEAKRDQARAWLSSRT